MDNDLISLIIPVYNRTPLLLETLTSVSNQSYKHWECLLIDDGSSPEHFNQIQNRVENDNRFLLLKRPNTFPKGANACRNLGLSSAKGTYIMFLDSDDLLKPDCLELRLQDFNTYPQCDFLVFQSQLFNNKPGDSDKILNVLNKPVPIAFSVIPRFIVLIYLDRPVGIALFSICFFKFHFFDL